MRFILLFPLILVLVLCSCDNKDEPIVFEEDLISIRFYGDTSGFSITYCLYNFNGDSYFCDENGRTTRYQLIGAHAAAHEFKYKYLKSNKTRKIVFTGGALCITSGPTKYLYGEISRIKDGDTVDSQDFMVRSFKIEEKPKMKDYSFEIEI